MNNKEIVEMKINGSLTKLESKMEMLKGILGRELENISRCKKLNKEYKPNSYGIVQAEGNEIDNLCGKIGALYEIMDVFNGEFK